MFQFFERKMNITINTFFLFGLISVMFGFMSLYNTFVLRLLVALLFFFVGSLFLYISYHIQDLRDNLREFMGEQQAKSSSTSAVSASLGVSPAKKPPVRTRKKKVPVTAADAA